MLDRNDPELQKFLTEYHRPLTERMQRACEGDIDSLNKLVYVQVVYSSQKVAEEQADLELFVNALMGSDTNPSQESKVIYPPLTNIVLGIAYHRGLGVQQNYTIAKEYFERVIEEAKKNSEVKHQAEEVFLNQKALYFAHFCLAGMYRMGEGIEMKTAVSTVSISSHKLEYTRLEGVTNAFSYRASYLRENYSIHTGDPNALAKKGMKYIKEGDKEKGLVYLHRAEEYESFVAYWMRGEFYEGQGNDASNLVAAAYYYGLAYKKYQACSFTVVSQSQALKTSILSLKNKLDAQWKLCKTNQQREDPQFSEARYYVAMALDANDEIAQLATENVGFFVELTLTERWEDIFLRLNARLAHTVFAHRQQYLQQRKNEISRHLLVEPVVDIVDAFLGRSDEVEDPLITQFKRTLNTPPLQHIEAYLAGDSQALLKFHNYIFSGEEGKGYQEKIIELLHFHEARWQQLDAKPEKTDQEKILLGFLLTQKVLIEIAANKRTVSTDAVFQKGIAYLKDVPLHSTEYGAAAYYISDIAKKVRGNVQFATIYANYLSSSEELKDIIHQKWHEAQRVGFPFPLIDNKPYHPTILSQAAALGNVEALLHLPFPRDRRIKYYYQAALSGNRNAHDKLKAEYNSLGEQYCQLVNGERGGLREMAKAAFYIRKYIELWTHPLHPNYFPDPPQRGRIVRRERDTLRRLFTEGLAKMQAAQKLGQFFPVVSRHFSILYYHVSIGLGDTRGLSNLANEHPDLVEEFSRNEWQHVRPLLTEIAANKVLEVREKLQKVEVGRSVISTPA